MLFIEPNAGPAPIVDVIQHASRVVELNVYEITSHAVERALKNACDRGVRVLVMLEAHPYHAADLVPKERRALSGTCVALKAAPPRFSHRYVFDHAKYVVSDPKKSPAAEVGTANYTWSAFHRNREYLWATTRATTVHALADVFAADWDRKPAGKTPRKVLVMSPHSTRLMEHLIGQQGPVDIEQEEVSGPKRIFTALMHKGKSVHLIVPDNISNHDKKRLRSLQSSGVQVRTIHSPFMHAKMILTPHIGFIGSQNCSRSSLNNNREIGVAFKARHAIKKLKAQFTRDWRAAEPFGQ